MKILIIGAGGREHALAATYAKSNRVKKIFVAPGNDFMEETSSKIQVFPQISLLDFDSMLSLVKKYDIDLVDVAQDNVLAEGFVDKLSKYGIPAFGPKKAAAEIEWNKDWARSFMKKYDLPIPRYKSFSNKTRALSHVKQLPEQTLFIKASGLALGKGVIKAENRKEAYAAIVAMKQFHTAGKTFLIEEGMTGEEFSLFAICDGKRYVIAGCAQDHKTVYNGDLGPNTGGMGCVAPTTLLNQQLFSQIKRTILNPFIHGMLLEDRPFTGIIYLGGMLSKKGPQVVEFNARWGEPEANVILPGLQTDYIDIVEAVMMQELMTKAVRFDNKVRISVAGCAIGYPTEYSKIKGKKIVGLTVASRLPGISVFGAGIKRKGKDYVVNGGRIFHLVAEGDNIAKARERAYTAMSHISVEGNNLHYRTDIGWRELARKAKK
ncbi:MAG: phosphoribosylamine--glycine ligase [Candidatus Levybacteria bacterium]|nr:phosphoribosylamine--glycine ligase [Candidatus Levybacteria bacterium]